MKKYELTKEMKPLADGTVLYRIRAVRDFKLADGTDVKSGDLGGWIEDEDNLSHVDKAWVKDSALVYGEAWVSGSALVYGEAQVYDQAEVFGEARVYDKAKIFGEARISGKAWIFGEARVYGKADVSGSGMISNATNKIETE